MYFKGSNMAVQTEKQSLYRTMAKQASKCDSKNFVFLTTWDDRIPFPRSNDRGRTDNPFAQWYGWWKIRGFIHGLFLTCSMTCSSKGPHLRIGL